MTVMIRAGDHGECPNNTPSQFTCDGVHLPGPMHLCPVCMHLWLAWHEARGLDPQTYTATAHNITCDVPPCPGFKSGPKLAPYKPGEDELSDKTRSTLGRLFGGDITE